MIRLLPRALLLALLFITQISILGLTGDQALAQEVIFTGTVNLSNNPASSHLPLIAASADNVYIVWQDDTNGNPDIFFRASNDGGASFGATINLSSNSGLSLAPRVAAVGNSVYVVWQDDSTGNDEVFFRASTNNGASFNPTVNLSNLPGNSTIPQLAAVGDNVYVVWQDDVLGDFEIFFRSSLSNGATFGTIFVLSNNPGSSLSPRITAVGKFVYVVWRDDSLGNFETFFKTSADNGASFGSTVNLSSNAGTTFLYQMAATETSVYVVWEDNTVDPFVDLFFRSSMDNGASFGITANLSNNSGISIDPQVAALGVNVYVVWRDNSLGNYEVFFRSSTNNGASFGTVTNLSGNLGASLNPQLAAFANNVYVAWEDNSDAVGLFEVFFRSSFDWGLNFGTTINLSSNAGFSLNPRVASYSKHVYTVWQDDTLGNHDILLLSGSVVASTPPASVSRMLKV